MRKSKRDAPFSLFAFQDAITSVCGVVVLITLMLALELTRRATDDEAPVKTDARQVLETRDEIVSLQNEIASLVEESQSNALSFEAASGNLSKSEALDALQEAQKRLEEAQRESSRLQEERKKTRAFQDEIASLEKRVDDLTKEQSDATNALESAKKDADKAKKDALRSDLSEFYVFPQNGRETHWFVELTSDRLTLVGSERRQDFSDVESFVDWAKKRSRREEYFVLIARPSGVENFERVAEKLQAMDFRIGVDLIGENKQLQFLSSAAAE